jgi:pimeloyl-ACP methyl ester carboxylesterase
VAVTFVLIHGGGATGRFWDLVAPLLPGRVLAVDLPGRGRHPADLASVTVDDEVASVVADVEQAGPADDPVVVVAHSSGGLVVPGVVAALGDRVARIVLNAAHVPPEGGRGVDCMQPRHRDGLVAAKDGADGDGTAIILPAPGDPERLRTAYGGEPLDDEQLAFVSDPVRSVADTVNHYFQPVRWSAAAGVPVTYVVNQRDRPIPVALQEQLVANLPAPPAVVRLPTGHVPAVTCPEVLAAAIRGELRGPPSPGATRRAGC